MNDQEFIELLNLYVDREITGEQAALLEAEVVRDLKRRSIYNQYCRIQKACQVLAKNRPDEEIEAPTFVRAPAPVFANRLYGAGLLAAAACVVAAIVMRQPHAPEAAVRSQSVAVATTAPSARLESVANLKPSFLEPAPELDWISQIRVAPVQHALPADLVFATKADELKAVHPIQVQGQLEGPAERTAFQISE